MTIRPALENADKSTEPTNRQRGASDENSTAGIHCQPIIE